MPDEPAWSQFRRMARENGLHGRTALSKLVPEGGSRDEWLAVREKLAFLMSGASRHYQLSDYFKKHSIYPQLISFSCLLNRWQSLLYRWASHHANLYPSKRVVRSCPECAREDVMQFGFAWYRQGHQLPGVDWCLQHACSLYQVPTGLDLIRLTSWKTYQVPHATVADPQPLPPFIHRYLRALEWLRRARHGFAWTELGRETNLIAFGPITPDYHNFGALERRIVAAAPTEWYQTHFVDPKLTRMRPLSCPEGSKSPVLALRAACITQSDEDLNVLFSNTAVATEAIKERLRQWRKSGGQSTTAESPPEDGAKFEGL